MTDDEETEGEEQDENQYGGSDQGIDAVEQTEMREEDEEEDGDQE
jgi:hypothetical protein